jgi:hypothetical protein
MALGTRSRPEACAHFSMAIDLIHSAMLGFKFHRSQE